MSSVSPHLLHVNSRPTVVSDKLWSEWYTIEHLPDLVNTKTSTRAAFYEETGVPGLGEASHPRKFLALYQTDHAECLKTQNYIDIRTTSELFPPEGGTKNIGDNGDFDARNYKLVQEYDPKGVGNTPPPEICTIEMSPKNQRDFGEWYREEHLPLLSKAPGYRRTLRYRLGPKTPLTKDDEPPAYLAVHEVDSLEKWRGKETDVADGTEWTKKQLAESKVFVARGWRLIHAEGF